MVDFLLAAVQNDNGVAMQEWYLEGTGASEVTAGTTRVGPGPNTITKMGFEDIKETCEKMADKIAAGTVERRNELGMQYLAPDTWPESPGGIQSIGLGQTNENHAFIRPLIVAELDNGLSTGHCDGSDCWNSEYLNARAEAFFEGRTSLESSDAKWFVTQILHKIHLNLDLDEATAREFADYMSSMITLIPLTENVLYDPLTARVLGQDPAATIEKKLQYLEDYKAAVRVKYAGEDWVGDDERVNLVASVFMDSLQFAGGLSVPSVLSLAMGLTHMAEANKPDSLKSDVAADEDWVLWETLRKYAPVAGVPFWERAVDGGLTHVIPNVAQALMDSSVFPEPLVFKNRGLGFYHTTMGRTSAPNAGMGWAGSAIASDKDTANPNSHNCPAQDLSFKLMKSFLKAFERAGPWSAVDSDEITVNQNGISGFTLLKKGLRHSTGCQWRPKCNDGYVYSSTNWSCWWGKRDWTCVVA